MHRKIARLSKTYHLLMRFNISSHAISIDGRNASKEGSLIHNESSRVRISYSVVSFWATKPQHSTTMSGFAIIPY
jgi:hypothetical protein